MISSMVAFQEKKGRVFQANYSGRRWDGHYNFSDLRNYLKANSSGFGVERIVVFEDSLRKCSAVYKGARVILRETASNGVNLRVSPVNGEDVKLVFEELKARLGGVVSEESS